MGGDFFQSLFGGGASIPDPEPAVPLPARQDGADADERSVREAEQRKNRARAGGVRSTLLSNPLGGQSPLGSGPAGASFTGGKIV